MSAELLRRLDEPPTVQEATTPFDRGESANDNVLQEGGDRSIGLERPSGEVQEEEIKQEYEQVREGMKRVMEARLEIEKQADIWEQSVIQRQRELEKIQARMVGENKQFATREDADRFTQLSAEVTTMQPQLEQSMRQLEAIRRQADHQAMEYNAYAAWNHAKNLEWEEEDLANGLKEKITTLTAEYNAAARAVQAEDPVKRQAREQAYADLMGQRKTQEALIEESRASIDLHLGYIEQAHQGLQNQDLPEDQRVYLRDTYIPQADQWIAECHLRTERATDALQTIQRQTEELSHDNPQVRFALADAAWAQACAEHDASHQRLREAQAEQRAARAEVDQTVTRRSAQMRSSAAA